MMRYAIAAAFLVLLPGTAASAPSLSADLSIGFSCPAPPSEASIEAFLAARGFHVANEERVRRQLGRGFFPLQIEAFDDRRRTVTVQGLIGPDGSHLWTPQTSYFIGIYSPPPTQHDEKLEADAASLVETTLDCAITSRNRGDNGADAAAYFDQIFDMQKSRAHEAAVCDRTLASYDEKLCAAVPGH